MSMQTRHIHLNAETPDMALIAVAAETIRKGGLVAFPTETVYGLGANAWDEAAVEGIFRAKGRPANDPLIAHIADVDQLAEVTREAPDIAHELCRRFWPGPLTVVLKKARTIPANLTAGLDTVAVRMPAHPVALALIEAAAVPIAAPSANKFSRPSPTSARHVLDDLAGRVDIVLDAGSARIGVESTIVSLSDGQARVLRPGGISLEDLRQVMPDLRFEPTFLSEDEAAPAPGGMLKHYSPTARVMLFHGENDAAVYEAMRAEIACHDRVGLLATDADADAFAGLDIKLEGLGASNQEAALRLFAALRTLDKQGVDLILARLPDKSGLGLAVWDRLLRAAVGSLIEVE